MTSVRVFAQDPKTTSKPPKPPVPGLPVNVHLDAAQLDQLLAASAQTTEILARSIRDGAHEIAQAITSLIFPPTVPVTGGRVQFIPQQTMKE